MEPSPSNPRRPRVIVFAKYPEPGRVKTRMVPPLTHEEAARLHRACLEAVLERVMSIRGVDARLAVAPDEMLDAFAFELSITTGRCQGQGDGDLGERLERAMHAAFDEDASAVVFLGSDSPTLPERHLLDAVSLLRGDDSERGQSEAVMGPCCDGGYYLIGMSRPIPALFGGVEWGSERVAEQTRIRARKAGVRLDELPEWYDIDRLADLERARRELHEAQDALLREFLPQPQSLLPPAWSFEDLIAKLTESDMDLGIPSKQIELAMLIDSFYGEPPA